MRSCPASLRRLLVRSAAYNAAMSVPVNAVYYGSDAYAPLSRRLSAFFVDLIVTLLLFSTVLVVGTLLVVPAHVRTMPPSEESRALVAKHAKPYRATMTWTGLGVVAAYHILLRRTSAGTVGYRLTGIRLVDAYGLRPALPALLKRFLIAVPACMLLGWSYSKCRTYSKRQAFHDLCAGTWVIRKHKEPAGPAIALPKPRMIGAYPFAFILQFVELDPAEDNNLAGAEASADPGEPSS